ncbi:MAG TPA: protein kinase [Kofleriaceae bacterium]|nr:protein kinase [Kofleriaceae bacterium]
MGEVYKARDRRLGRTIAIKFLLGADPNLTIRFLREARAQARIDHPSVCHVYEVGEVEGRVYIALQLVAGEPLHKAAAHMSLDEKIAVLRDVAAAIHEAHRLGIVHRDLKPANVMVERTEDGRWFPVVMDFGLAREVTVEAGITESGALLGTPGYMSPEQARGDVRAVDRRSDVYSLGATLYELLTGRMPFPGSTLATTLAQVIHDDPPAPRSLVPSVPIDLETIALKCLAKDPTQRYESARALAEDLGRYLDGEPILGRRLSRWQRLRLRARRHRALVVLGAWSLAIILAVGAFGVRAWIHSIAERERTAESTHLAERLGREVTAIESSLREAYLWPLHDTRPDRQHVRERMKDIAATDHDLGAFGDAVIHEALGRGHLALHEWREAADELGRAKAGGRQSPELHAALGRALGELYRRGLEEARRSQDKEWAARRQQELARQYLTPALAEIEQIRTSGWRAAEDAGLLDARVALYRREFDAAEKQAFAIAERSPGLSEARKIAADAAYGAAIEAIDRGDYDTARPLIERATTLYAEASEVVRSDASVYEAAAQAWLQRAEVDFHQGRLPRESLERALDIIDHRALSADPDDAGAYTTKSYVLLRWYRTPALSSQGDQRPLLDRIARAAARAVEIDPRDAHAWTSLGYAHVTRGRYEYYYGGHGVPWINGALQELGQALTIRPDDVQAISGTGEAHRGLGAVLEKTGRDPMPEYQAALRSYERAAAIDARDLLSCVNQIELHVTIAEYTDAIGIDPRPAIGDARRAGERCLKINPKYHSTLDNLAQAQLALAHYLVETGGDPTAELRQARDYLDLAETAQPETGTVWYHRLVAAVVEATSNLHRGDDPTSAIATGRVALEEARRLIPSSAYPLVWAARLDLIEAAWAARTGKPQMPLLEQALSHAKSAVARDGQFALAHLTAAEVCLEIARTRSSRSAVDDGIAYVDQARRCNPQLRKAETVEAALLRLRPR